MPRINFNDQSTRRQPIRTVPAKFLSSKLRGHVERSDGLRPAEAFMPYKALPVMQIDTETGDGIVINKGTVVSALTNQTHTSVTPSGIVNVASSGTIPVFQDATLSGNDIVMSNIDDSFWGYPDSVAGLLVPANGGIQSRLPYSADDATLSTFTASGKVVSSAMASDPESNYCLLEPNMPIGVAHSDVYQDIRGKYLNYNLWEIWGIVCDSYIEVPYVDFSLETSFVSGYCNAIDEHPYNLDSTTCAGYLETWRKHAFMYIDGTADQYDGHAGQLVQPDLTGKFIPQGTANTTSATAQTIGKLLLTDSRFPKSDLEMVDTYPGSQMPGTETGGLPSILFNFARDSKYGIEGSYPTISEIVAAVQNGYYGIARIQLNI